MIAPPAFVGEVPQPDHFGANFPSGLAAGGVDRAVGSVGVAERFPDHVNLSNVVGAVPVALGHNALNPWQIFYEFLQLIIPLFAPLDAFGLLVLVVLADVFGRVVARLTISHELGHFYIERHNDYLRGGGRKHGSHGEFSTNNVVEREADSFAAAMLMPSFIMGEHVNEAELSIDRIVEMAGLFQTSFVSTALRAVALSDWPCAVVAIRKGSVAWVSRADSLIRTGFYPPSRGAFTSPTARKQWQDFQMGVAASTSAPVYARHWFKTYDRTDLEQVSITEHYLPVPIMETLIVLLTIPEDELNHISNYDD